MMIPLRDGIVLLLIIIAILCAGCAQPAQAPQAVQGTPVPAVTAAASYMDVTPVQAKALIDSTKDLVIVDVSPYYANGHLPGALSIPLETLDGKIPTLDKTKPYLVYCHGDAPSISGATKLVNAGFSPVYRLQGNYAAWVDAGYPVEK